MPALLGAPHVGQWQLEQWSAERLFTRRPRQAVRKWWMHTAESSPRVGDVEIGNSAGAQAPALSCSRSGKAQQCATRGSDLRAVKVFVVQNSRTQW
jgi:hypothetical protein